MKKDSESQLVQIWLKSSETECVPLEQTPPSLMIALDIEALTCEVLGPNRSPMHQQKRQG